MENHHQSHEDILNRDPHSHHHLQYLPHNLHPHPDLDQNQQHQLHQQYQHHYQPEQDRHGQESMSMHGHAGLDLTLGLQNYGYRVDNLSMHQFNSYNSMSSGNGQTWVNSLTSSIPTISSNSMSEFCDSNMAQNDPLIQDLLRNPNMLRNANSPEINAALAAAEAAANERNINDDITESALAPAPAPKTKAKRQRKSKKAAAEEKAAAATGNKVTAKSEAREEPRKSKQAPPPAQKVMVRKQVFSTFRKTKDGKKILHSQRVVRIYPDGSSETTFLDAHGKPNAPVKKTPAPPKTEIESSVPPLVTSAVAPVPVPVPVPVHVQMPMQMQMPMTMQMPMQMPVQGSADVLDEAGVSKKRKADEMGPAPMNVSEGHGMNLDNLLEGYTQPNKMIRDE